MSVLIAAVPQVSQLSQLQRQRLVRIYRDAFAKELAWMEDQGRSTTSTLGEAAAFSYIFDNKKLLLAVHVKKPPTAKSAEPAATSWIEEVTERSVGKNQSPFTPKRPPAAPVAKVDIRDVAPSQILGFATVEQVYAHLDAFLRCVAVTGKARRLGVGGLLLNYVTTTFGSKSAVILEYWNGQPSWLAKFYKKHGFVTQARSSRPNYIVLRRTKDPAVKQ